MADGQTVGQSAEGDWETYGILSPAMSDCNWRGSEGGVGVEAGEKAWRWKTSRQLWCRWLSKVWRAKTCGWTVLWMSVMQMLAKILPMATTTR